MTNNYDTPPPTEPPWREPRLPPGCTIFMLIIGVLLLIPGALCVVLSVTLGGSNDPITGLAVLVTLGGLGLIVFARAQKRG
ncbi:MULTISPECIES: hypothetical protein [unclassified Bradyrhizobium]|uniref:hypothetical protein n=1 Tax=unclassified Bradyrhizobium TaxID=2631580 RepID=UPI001BA6954A|nr:MULTISPECIES: hypothetical protein [unclassified Bradyrhizobium]MBR1207673.1 hypothetical protein [Bradyrhizobium sp. AUGA SZCCT0124]MBR1317004.1 hypothetical protein [Bradyrhizobium sp. AUGA SZCCT0051]MBR1345480.1 hypothetical protein [Bradyrhizobium sp. AUGA SZCCT0105]MBR1360168.1 hypothetical protein [Bradyrhizobium sp. AUGA SZCCT0045]